MTTTTQSRLYNYMNHTSIFFKPVANLIRSKEIENKDTYKILGVGNVICILKYWH